MVKWRHGDALSRRFQELAHKYALDPDVVTALRDAFEDDVELPEPVTQSTTHSVPALTGMTWLPNLDIDDADTAEIVLGASSADRFEDLGPIGIGGMGEVRRVRDPVLDRIVAMKVLRTKHLASAAHAARFLDEARTTAKLEHPGIIPVHELGKLPDGRVFFTMKEVRGRTLSTVIRDVHLASNHHGWCKTHDDWTLRRLIDALYRVSEATSYAHSRGVLHRDLKPSNVMVDSFGEVVVMDWGLAKLLGSIDGTNDITLGGLSGGGATTTRVGSVSGTPAYMSPEQARGESDLLGPESDVYALGSILYEMLTGTPPYQGTSGQQVVDQVISGPPPPAGAHTTGPPVPEDLAQICDKAMSRAVDGRYRHAGELASVLSEWLVGARREEQAIELLTHVRTMDHEVQHSRARATALQRQACKLAENISKYASVEAKRGLWAVEDEATTLNQKAHLLELEANELARTVLSFIPNHPAAQARLADYYHRRHRQAESARDHQSAAAFEVLLRAHGARRYAGYLKGTGLLNVVTDPPNASVELYEMVERDRRLVPDRARRLGKTPITAVELPVGRYLLLIKARGCVPVRHPIEIERNGFTHGTPPGAEQPHAIHLPSRSELGSRECYVPASWMRCGGDPVTSAQFPTGEVWVDSFAIQRHQVTFADLLVFFDSLKADGRTDAIAQLIPRDRGASSTGEGSVFMHQNDRGEFALFPDAEGDLYNRNWPAFLVDHALARAYAKWWARRTGQAWRLPTEIEWEKAARGTDGRFFPWGDRFDTSFCAMYESASRALPVPVTAYPFDESPYGVRGMSGGTRDWCAQPYRIDPSIEDGTLVGEEVNAGYPVRGGAWNYGIERVRVAYRNHHDGHHRYNNLGFRLARTL